MNPQTNITFHKVAASNLTDLAEGISALHREVGGDWRSPAFWRWAYGANPAGGTGSVVALRDGRVVGKLGNVYVRFAVKGERVRAGLLEGFCVLPSERTWQCTRGLILSCFAEDAEERFAFGYSFSTASAAQVSKRTGGVILGRVPVFGGFINAARVLEGRGVPWPISLAGCPLHVVAGLKHRGSDDSGLTIRTIERFDGAFDELWAAAEKTRSVSAVRDAAYLNWRYLECPDRSYTRAAAFRGEQLEGFAVFSSRPSRNTGYLLELQARGDNPQVLRVLLGQAIEALAKNGVGLVTASFPAGSAEAEALAKMGFQRWVSRLWNIQLVISKVHSRQIGPELALENWHFSLGDWLSY